MFCAIPANFPTGPNPGNPSFQYFQDTDPAPAFDSLVENFIFTSPPPSSYPVVSTSSGSDTPIPNQTTNRSKSNNSSGDSVVDERKRRRMISNRESARRSRMRKQKHLENLRNQVNRLRVENRELTNRLRLVLYHFYRLRMDNDQLRSEHTMLRHKLSNIRQILLLQQLQQHAAHAWPCNSTQIIDTCERTPSLIA